jgi:hypothetical protein
MVRASKLFILMEILALSDFQKGGILSLIVSKTEVCKNKIGVTITATPILLYSSNY